MRTYLEHMTDADLLERGLKLAAMLKATESELARGNRGRVIGSHILRGAWVKTYSNESARNSQAGSLETTRQEWRNRQANKKAGV